MGKGAAGGKQSVKKSNRHVDAAQDDAFFEELQAKPEPVAPRTLPWRRILAIVAATLVGHAAIALSVLQDRDPGYYFKARYDNIGNIELAKDAPFMGYPPIDVVYTWVNGSDPRWKREKDYWHRRWKAQINGEIFDETDESHVHDASASATENRFRDNEELRYSLRSIEMYAPWIRHVYLVTDGQIPSWLNVESPRLTIVPHRDIFKNQSHLPVFSSPAIESNLDNIPGLSSLFLYFNDDVFLGAPVQPEDFISPSGVQNIYLSWEVPECSSGCKESFLGNNVCDPMCNTTACAFDMGDCGCREVPTEDPLVFDVVCEELPTPENESQDAPSDDAASTESATPPNPLNCVEGCSWTWVGDGACDQKCNVTECGYDAGDCTLDALTLLPSVFVNSTKTPSTLGVQVPLFVDALVVRFDELFDFIDYASVVGDDLVRRAVMLEENMTMLVLFARKDTTGSMTNASVIKVEGEKNETARLFELRFIRGERTLSHGAYTPLVDGLKDMHIVRQLHSESPNTTDVIFMLPFHAIPDWSLSLGVTNSFDPSIVTLCPPVVPEEPTDGTPVEYPSMNCRVLEKQIEAQWALNVEKQPDAPIPSILQGEICVHNGETKLCATTLLSLDPSVTWVSPIPPEALYQRDIAQLPWTGEWIEAEDCILVDWFLSSASAFRGQCTSFPNETDQQQEEAPPTPDPELVKKAKAMCSTIARRLKEREGESSSILTKMRDGFQKVKTVLGINTLEELQEPRHHMLTVDDVEACEAYFTTNPIELPSPRKDEHAVSSTDTFGDSLRFVNKLYNAKFGKIDGPYRRRVPSHMPHFIQKKYLTEMKKEWEAEFNATSSHRFRHPKDMQFSFSYMYYVVNRHKVHPPTLEEIYETYIDINHDGMIDEHEALSVASLLTTGEHPSEEDIADVKACITPPTTETKRDEVRREGKVTITETTQPYLTIESLRACENVTKRLVQTAINRLPPTHRMMTEDQVTFHMLSDQYRTAWNQLLNTRAKRTKFICINDDMKYPSTAVGNILNDLFSSLWPHRSQFELPYHLKNRYSHVDELAASTRTTWLLAGVAVTVLVLIVLACCWDSRGATRSTKTHAETTKVEE